MNNKTLFVDDEPALLNGIRRGLGLEFDVDLASSGQEGLDLIRQNGPYPVVFTDMRMPAMNGLQFLEQANKAAPDTSYIMLTGNNDQETAARAVNEGQVFRFLCKPCEAGELRRTIEDGRRHYELIRSEKQLLQSTFVGAVRALTDVVEVCRPELAGRPASVEKKVDALRDAVGIDDRWEFRIAARLSLLGVALLPDEERKRFQSDAHTTESITETYDRAAKITERVLEGIPRLETVSQICGQVEEISGNPCSLNPKKTGAIVQVGATLIRIAAHWDFLSHQGLNGAQAVTELRRILPETPDGMLEAIAEEVIEPASTAAVKVPISQLAPGMVTATDVMDSTGSVLLRKGQRLTNALVEKLSATDGVPALQITALTASLSADAS